MLASYTTLLTTKGQQYSFLIIHPSNQSINPQSINLPGTAPLHKIQRKLTNMDAHPSKKRRTSKEQISQLHRDDTSKEIDRNGVNENTTGGDGSGSTKRGYDFLNDLRNNAQQLLSRSDDERDVEYMVELVRGLIGANNEIWERCKDHMAERKYELERNSRFVFRNKVKMMRMSYQRVHVKTKQHDELKQDKLEDGTRTGPISMHISVNRDPNTRDFELPPSIPRTLTNIIAQAAASIRSRHQLFPDYRAYLNNAVLLQDDVLKYFLQVLQNHLEEVQLYLGKIEEWLSEPQLIAEFLNELFKSSLKVRRIRQRDLANNILIDKDAICVKCFRPCSQHDLNLRPPDSLFLCRKLVGYVLDGEKGKFHAPYLGSTEKYLFYANEVPGHMNWTFNLNDKEDREKLKMMWSFVKMYRNPGKSRNSQRKKKI
mmetsp:Transcript_18449/g.28047  ORF Transcript_18449/g.28047 Transcript_18449/m.28047 type:complete len:428 (+) Transcript_18449:49-1332(+)